MHAVFSELTVHVLQIWSYNLKETGLFESHHAIRLIFVHSESENFLHLKLLKLLVPTPIF